MAILLNGVTANTTAVAHRDPYAGNPCFTVIIEGGTASVSIHQGNTPDSMQVIDTVTVGGQYSIDGIGDYYAASATSVSGATVTVISSVKDSLLSRAPLHPEDI